MSLTFKIQTFLLVLLLATQTGQYVRAQVVADSSAAADSLLIRELEREMGLSETTSNTSAGTTARTAPSLNPNISVIGDFRAMYLSDAERNIDAELHEVEGVLSSVVDPYARADFFFAVGNDGEGGFEFELEEAYLTTLSLPLRLQARVGKFRSVFGKLNRIHPHALPFIDTPAIYANYLGDEGLNDQGLSVSWLLPNRRFFQDLTVDVTRGPAESESFEHQDSNDLLYVGHLKNFWDLSDNSTLELGLSGARGANPDGLQTLLGGIDITYIWKPLRFKTYKSLMLQGESFFSRAEVEEDDAVSTWGFFALGSYQLARRWFFVVRFDHSDLPDNPSWNENAVSGTLRWNATEFQKLEFGLRSSEAREMDRNYQVLFRAVFVIGAHGAHEY